MNDEILKLFREKVFLWLSSKNGMENFLFMITKDMKTLKFLKNNNIL